MSQVTQLVWLGLGARSPDAEICPYSPRTAVGHTWAENLAMHKNHPWGCCKNSRSYSWTNSTKAWDNWWVFFLFFVFSQMSHGHKELLESPHSEGASCSLFAKSVRLGKWSQHAGYVVVSWESKNLNLHLITTPDLLCGTFTPSGLGLTPN